MKGRSILTALFFDLRDYVGCLTVKEAERLLG